MKVLLVAPTPFFSDRGYSVRVYLQAYYSQKAGAEIRLCTYHLGQNIPGLDIKRIGNVSWYKKISPGFSWGKGWLAMKLLFLTIKEIRRFEPDIIQGYQYEGLVIGKLAKMLAGFDRTRLVADIQGDLREEFGSYNRNNLMAKIFVFFARRFIHWADEVVVSSERCKLPVPATVIADGADTDLFEKMPAAKTVGYKTLLYTGGMSDNKGVGALLRAFTQGTKSGQMAGWRLLLAGTGYQAREYEAYIAENGLGDRIERVDLAYFDQPRICAQADAAIDPKHNSGEGSAKLMTYLAAGLPVICFEDGFNRARAGSQAIFINDINELPAALEKIPMKPVKYNLQGWAAADQAQKLLAIWQK